MNMYWNKTPYTCFVIAVTMSIGSYNFFPSFRAVEATYVTTLSLQRTLIEAGNKLHLFHFFLMASS